MVPEGHSIQVHPPGVQPMPQAGMVHDPAAMGAKAAMDAAVPTPEQHAPKDTRGAAQTKTKTPAPKNQTKRKSAAKKVGII